jgi:hypothetical protein
MANTTQVSDIRLGFKRYQPQGVALRFALAVVRCFGHRRTLLTLVNYNRSAVSIPCALANSLRPPRAPLDFPAHTQYQSQHSALAASLCTPQKSHTSLAVVSSSSINTPRESFGPLVQHTATATATATATGNGDTGPPIRRVQEAIHCRTSDEHLIGGSGGTMSGARMPRAVDEGYCNVWCRAELLI